MSGPARRPRWIGLAGPTASGKTAVALQLARSVPLEIISVDSALIYRGMDIGTAKPSPDELAQVPHHLIDLLDPAQSYSAAQFVADARRLVDEITARGRLPLLVGGTMLYFKALIDGLDAMPPADPAVRAEIDAQAAAEGWPAMHAQLALVDPVTAARLAPNDAQRVQRALEVWRQTGRPLSTFHSRGAASGEVHAPRGSGQHAEQLANQQAEKPAGQPGEPRADHLLISLEPTDRAWLHHRIAQRFDTMLAQGLLDEVRALRTRADLHPGLPSIRCVGYRQAWEALDAGLAGPALEDTVRERGSAATRQLAKRQITWLRSLARHAVAADGMDPGAEVARQVDEVLGSA